ncbi:MAG TPA: Asp-tRNA(Asn)/Glu-tRNA(Gln) amidotransferase subunit GatA [Phycisphaerae bacterium]|nr:Asp-tRNA(Asn)/Glu-tRNA(Gln) amidotransferase subunit GatA [Phycisphaerae bacterium]
MADSVTQEVEAALRRIKTLDPQLRCMIATLDQSAIARARVLDGESARGQQLGALHGRPVAVKDNICTDVGTTTCASRILAGFHAPYNAHVVERLLDDGAVVVGKTNMDEFAMGSSTENSGLFRSKNPWDPERVPGGSSGGSAAAVAARMVTLALGSETGGSVRQPASFCGVCGLKPSYGRVSRYGLVAFGSSLDQVGVIAADVKGVALLLRTIAGRDRRDATSVDEPVPDYVARLDEPVSKIRIGVAAEYFGEGLHAETRKAVEAAIELYQRLGAEVHEIRLPHAAYTIACYYIVCTAEASSNLARYDGVRYGHRTARPTDYIDLYSASREEGFGAEVKRRIMLGTYVLSSGYYDAYYLKALKVRTLIKDDFAEAFKKCDVIVSPTTPTPAFKFGEKTQNPLEMYLADIYNCAANLAGIPAISIPCGFTASGLPIGLQLMAPHFGEARLLQIASVFQHATDHHLQRPPIHAA